MAKLRFEHEREKLQRLSERLRKQSAEPDSVEVDVIEETGVIVVRGREADVNQITELTKPQGESPQPAEADFQFQVITLQYGDAEAIVVVLQDLFYRQSPEQVVVSFDERTNSVIARGTAADLAAIEALVERLDRE